MPSRTKFQLGQSVRVVNDDRLDVPSDKLGELGVVQKVYDDNTYDVLFPDWSLINLTYYQLEEPTF